jgi:hypothetical protein
VPLDSCSILADLITMAANGANGRNGEPNVGTGTEHINIDIITLTRFLTEEQAKHKEATGDFTYTAPPDQKRRY